MEIKATDVKTLREKTGAGMMECKNALVETQGDFAKAEKLLKEKGLAAVEKRADRATNEGRIFVKVIGSKAYLVEVTCETDFVARNEAFIKLGDEIIDRAASKGYSEVNEDLSSMVTDLATKIRENMSLKRVKVLAGTDLDSYTTYIHGDGKIGVVVNMKSDKKEALANALVKTFAFDIALHIAAFNPMALNRGQIDAAHIAEQEEIFRKQTAADEKMAGKPANVIENVVKGKVNKYLSDICLLDQGFVKDEKQKVTQVLDGLSKQVGAKLEIANYVYFRVGA